MSVSRRQMSLNSSKLPRAYLDATPSNSPRRRLRTGTEPARVLVDLDGPFTRSLTFGAVGERIAEASARNASDRTARLPVPPAPARAGADAERDPASDEGERTSNSARLWRDDGGSPGGGAHARGCLRCATESGGGLTRAFRVFTLFPTV